MNNKPLTKAYFVSSCLKYFFDIIRRSTISPITTTLRVALLVLLLGTGIEVVIPARVNADPSLPTDQVPVGTAVVYVNPVLGTDNSGAGKNEATAYHTITYALEQSKAGTTIKLAPGTYSPESGEHFPLLVKPGIILQGEESTKGHKVVIRGGGAYLSPTFASQNTTFVAQQGSEIKGITITNPNTRGTGVWVESGNANIQNNTFVNNLREGIFVTGNAAPKITGNFFTQNSANGLTVAKAAQGEIRGNLFDNTGFGIAISETAAPLVINNIILNNKDGVVISHSARPVLRQNRIQTNKRYGVVLMTEAQPDFGNTSSPGNNILIDNGKCDLYNLTNYQNLSVIGNQIGISQRRTVELSTETPIEMP